MAAVKIVLKHLSTAIAGRKHQCHRTKDHEISQG